MFAHPVKRERGGGWNLPALLPGPYRRNQVRLVTIHISFISDEKFFSLYNI